MLFVSPGLAPAGRPERCGYRYAATIAALLPVPETSGIRNETPIGRAQRFQDMLQTGRAKNGADIARLLGCSRAWVTKVLAPGARAFACRTTRRPVLSGPPALPGNDGRGLDKHQRLLPSSPDSGNPSPDEAVRWLDTRFRLQALVDTQLMSECQDLQLHRMPRWMEPIPQHIPPALSERKCPRTGQPGFPGGTMLP